MVKVRSPRDFFQITRVTRKFDKATGNFVISINYKTTTDLTQRTVAVAEAFGLGIDEEKTQVLYDNVELRISDRDIVYITGDSGSGKSVLLRKLEHLLKPKTINIKDVVVAPYKPIIETVGKTLEEGLELLSKAGLNDAFLFIRRYDQLSEGQKYRYKIAKLMESVDKQFWVMDEFCSLLDRETAKIVAYNVQKLARQMQKGVLVATTHTDLLEDLKPTVHIHKSFGRKVEITYYQKENAGITGNHSCSLTKKMRLVEGTLEDYKKLAEYHYRTSGKASLPPPRKIFKIICETNLEPVGVIIYSYPPPLCFGRKKAMKGQTLSLQELNKVLSTISRVIVHPKYRSIGIGIRLVRETLSKAGTPYVETIAVMAKYNPFFERAGMKKILVQKPNAQCLQALKKLQALGFNILMFSSLRYSQAILRRLDAQRLMKLKEILASIAHPRIRRVFLPSQPYTDAKLYLKILRDASLEKLAKALQVLSMLTQTKVYLFWQNTTAHQ